MGNMFKDPVVIPVKVEKEFKNLLLNHCREHAMILSALMRKLLEEYAEKEGLIK